MELEKGESEMVVTTSKAVQLLQEPLFGRNCMKLLELDNVVDEERLLLPRQYNYCRSLYLGDKQEEMLSSRRKQLMLLGMNMLIYLAMNMLIYALNMMSRNYMKLLKLDNVVGEERFTMAVATPLPPTFPNEL